MLKLLTAFALAGVSTAIAIGADHVAAVQTPRVPPVAERLAYQPPSREDELIQSGASHRHVWMEVTAYCPCQKCCGPAAAGVTASGLPVTHNQGRFVAADTTVLPFGSLIRIPGYHGTEVPVIDRGGAIKGNKIDVYFPTHEEALQWCLQWLLVTVVE
jgi:3D (Asp-Asp-Asp) domain-containing protein